MWFLFSGKKVFHSKKETSNPKQSDEIPPKNYFNYSTIGQTTPMQFVFPPQTLRLTKKRKKKKMCVSFKNHIFHEKRTKKSEHNWNFSSAIADAKKSFEHWSILQIGTSCFAVQPLHLQWSKNHFLFVQKFRFTHTHVEICTNISV